jgi:hypothetical protein
MCHNCCSYGQKLSTKFGRRKKKEANPPANPQKQPYSSKTKEDLERECKAGHALVLEQKKEIERLKKVNQALKAQ